MLFKTSFSLSLWLRCGAGNGAFAKAGRGRTPVRPRDGIRAIFLHGCVVLWALFKGVRRGCFAGLFCIRRGVFGFS